MSHLESRSHRQTQLHHQGCGVGTTEQTCKVRLPLFDATPMHSGRDFPAFGARSSEAPVVDRYPGESENPSDPWETRRAKC